MSDDTSKLLKACVEYRAMVDKLECENAVLKQHILDDNKAYGCELRDPSGTIWDHAKRLQKENAALREAAQLALDTIIDGHKNGFRSNSGCYALPRLQAALGKEAQP